MITRTNEEWLADLRGTPEAQASAVEDMRARLKRAVFYYLSRERSDLAPLPAQELDQMAEDVAQDAVLRVLDHLDTFQGKSQFTTWATKVAVRLAISDLRRLHYRNYSLEDITLDGEFLPNIAANAPAAATGYTPPNPEDAAERDDVMSKISAALDEALTERQRQALVAVAIDGVPLEVVAERLNTNRNALYKLLHDARRKLRTHLEAQGLGVDYVMELFQQ